jgi:acyl-homoserine-lactone acylase
MKKWLLFLLLPVVAGAQASLTDQVKMAGFSKNVTIYRDNYGVPHIYGKTDADAVFGLMYAQCEDDFNRVEMNYIEKLGRMSEVKGESSLYDDLLIRLVIDSSDAKRDYDNSPEWLKKLMNAWADGINYYLFKHPNVKPVLITRFEPWYPLLWTDGSIGAISTADISMQEIKAFFSGKPDVSLATPINKEEAVLGSNGFAIAPSLSASHHALLYINPHVTFYFRPEVHMVSEEGLNVYGAVTWGQFFVYQGFNEHCGWMHTSSGVDAADSYIEKISRDNGQATYEYDHQQKPVISKRIVIRVKTADGFFDKTFNTAFTAHGPIVARRNGQLISLKADNRIMNGLIQCWQRTKTKSFADFKKTLDLQGNISNNTVYADAEGNIAYWHGNRVPRRDPAIDWSKPVDGSSSATDWKGYHDISEIVQSINPPNGWLQNCNSTPFTVAGAKSPDRTKYPAYMAPDGENFRGINAVRVLAENKNYDIDKLIAAGYDRRLTAFEVLVPAVVKAFYNSNTKTDYGFLEDAVKYLKGWDYRCSEGSIATTLAVHFGEHALRNIYSVKMDAGEDNDFVAKTKKFAATATASDLLQILSATVNDLKKKYGKWDIAWGQINRFQRISDDVDDKFDDSKPSFPDGFVSSTWGMLPSYSSRSFPNTAKRYGVNGNSFICAVEFGKKIKAKSLLAGGESGDPTSTHFFDQGEMYTKGKFKDVLFYKEDVVKHAERIYHP